MPAPFLCCSAAFCYHVVTIGFASFKIVTPTRYELENCELRAEEGVVVVTEPAVDRNAECFLFLVASPGLFNSPLMDFCLLDDGSDIVDASEAEWTFP